MTTIPDYLPILSRGAHTDPKDGACFMELASFYAGEEFTDAPRCADPMLAEVCRSVNDGCTDEQRRDLAYLIPRVIGTRQDGDMRRVHVRLACWAARQVLDLTPDRGAALGAIEAAEGWCGGEVTSQECANYAANAAAYAAANAAPYAAAYAAATPDAFLADLFDEFDRLTGHTPATIDADQWAEACTLTA